jgi:hypothetical protein
MTGLGVLDDKDHREGQRGHQSLEDGLPPRGKSDSLCSRASTPRPRR